MNTTKTELRRVAWKNVHNWRSEEGGTTRYHLTADAGLDGKTLCGRIFPATKGYPTAVRCCKACKGKAAKKGLPVTEREFWMGLDWVPGGNDY